MDNETKEMLQLILNKVTTLETDMSTVKQDVSGLKQDLSTVKQDVSGLKQDVSAVKQDVSGLKQDMSAVKQEVSDVKHLATKTAIVQENEVAKKIQLVYENQMTVIEHNNELKTYDNKIELLENDVFALKYAFKALKQG
ncbi:MAG: hypothetical protein RR576_03370 [Oscillospiraceae bacterium]